MLELIGLALIPIVILIIKKSNLVTTKKKNKILLNILLVLIPIIYIILCLTIRTGSFSFIKDYYSLEYMIFSGDYILYTGIILLSSPFCWIILVHFFKMIFQSLRIRKNAIIKKNEEYIYYRGDLDKISPSIIMFTSTFEVDIKKSISATILKLKTLGYIKEVNNTYTYTNKDESTLLESEKMVLNLIRFNNFDKNEYRKVIEQETLKSKYIIKNYGGIPIRLIKILIAICIPIAIGVFSTWLDEYVFENYHVWPEDDGHAYIQLENRNDIRKLHKEIKDENDYYHRSMFDGSMSYNYKEIRADKFEYSVVRKALYLNLLTTLIIGFEGVFVLASIYIIIGQIRYINKNYRRTIKGKNLLNKAYALKNYLKDYSLIKNRTEEELILWEYYLIYAVILDVNVKIEDKLIEKYVKSII